MQRLLNATFCLSRVGLGQPLILRGGVGSSNRRLISSSIARLASERPPPQTTKISLQAESIKRREESYKLRNRSLLIYSTSVFVLVVGFTYAAVPLYRAFCSATGFGGAPIVGLGKFAPSQLFPQYFDRITNSATRRIRVIFNADHSEALPWNFKPSQSEIYVLPGETALAFYQAKNKGSRDITGIATYNVSPDRVSGQRT
jgi:cytochrome c oxidase assembly protein Cox11